MKVFDAHCDVLMKLLEKPTINFEKDDSLEVSVNRLKQGESKIQCYAIYIPENVHKLIKFDAALQCVTLFYEKVATENNNIKVIRTKEDEVGLKSHEMGAILTLEGCDALLGDINRLKILHRLGVRSVGLVWNYANETADGILEERNGGLTNFGRSVVHYLNEHNMWCDLSHCSEAAFWDAFEQAKYPTATHSNAKAICKHPRNLNDEQLKAMFNRGAIVGINFYPAFLVDEGVATISDIIKHIDYMCSLGGEKYIAMGSDFDGIDTHPTDLHHVGLYQNLTNELLKYYTEQQVKGFMYENYSSYIHYK
ncbi:diguanylate cyclase [Bacillus sp. AFS002410]|uniref:dipeptidase n=1 Tax=Bacillus sp. AFS002410 TaxID=2033481 RepID=UPI000BF04DCA|nr:dipeptidase [Bacillus sp. AFS002410]PEJ60178.1 diguanylate cyclase [Bacillus sp. AFS002410]